MPTDEEILAARVSRARRLIGDDGTPQLFTNEELESDLAVDVPWKAGILVVAYANHARISREVSKIAQQGGTTGEWGHRYDAAVLFLEDAKAKAVPDPLEEEETLTPADSGNTASGHVATVIAF